MRIALCSLLSPSQAESGEEGVFEAAASSSFELASVAFQRPK
jgi:hypothetical protein